MAFHLESLAAGNPSKATESTEPHDSGDIKRGKVGQVPGSVITVNITQDLKRRMCSEGSGSYVDLSSPAEKLAGFANSERSEPALPHGRQEGPWN